MVEPYEGVGFAVYSYNLMTDVYNDGRADRKDLEQIASDIDASYPWDERYGWRYKEWLRARREFFEDHGLPGLQPRRSLKLNNELAMYR